MVKRVFEEVQTLCPRRLMLRKLLKLISFFQVTCPVVVFIVLTFYVCKIYWKMNFQAAASMMSPPMSPARKNAKDPDKPKVLDLDFP